VVRRYLEALRANKPTRGRERTAASIGNRLAVIDEQLGSADPVAELKLVQERLNLTGELATLDDGVDAALLEAKFVAVAKSYSERQGISYGSWREVGVPAGVLNQASIARNS
jgi:hypothetical protein